MPDGYPPAFFIANHLTFCVEIHPEKVSSRKISNDLTTSLFNAKHGLSNNAWWVSTSLFLCYYRQ
jgi:hypothetical protein